MINISVSLADATVTGKETLTAGRVGLQCQLSFSADWNDLQKIVVCEGAETREVPLTGDTITVPPECMATAGYRLRIGVMGISASEEIVIPTVWAKVGKILESADVGGDIYPEATPSVVAQIMENSATALELAQDVANAAARGDFNGAPGADGANATIVGATGSVDDQVGTPSVEVTVGGSDTERTFDFAFHNMKGEKGDTGDKGDTGNTGAAATVAVGTTTTGDAGTNAAVTNSGTSSAAVLNFTIPKGDKGDKGDTGNTGATPAFSVGTVTTGAAGSSAAATISGTAAAPVLNLTIPQGLKGDAGNGDMVADDFSTSNAYAVGDYVIYSGSLYRFTTAHAAGAWNASHATAVQLAEDVGELKSAFTVLKLPLIQGGYINAEGNFPSSDNFSISDFCPFSVGDNFELFDFNNASWSSYCLGYAFYDSSKTYISGSGSGNFDGHLSSASVTIPQNTAYVRFSTRTQFSPNAYIIISYINGAVNKIDRKFAGKQDVIPTIITVGNQTGCDYSTIQSAIDAITDDSQLKPYIIRVLPGTYDLFTLRGVTSVNPRYISIIGTDAINTIIQDNRGNYDYPAAAIQTNGTIENLTFINRTDAEHHTQTQGRTFAYAMHIDFGSVKLKVINCLFICNAGPAVGVGTWQDCELEFNDCKFISECDGTFGAKTNGAFFAHTGLLNDITNQNLTIKNSVAISQYDSTGARFVIISGYTGGRYNYNFQNFGAFGNNGASAAIVDPNSELIGDYSFNNVPNTLNTPNS